MRFTLSVFAVLLACVAAQNQPQYVVFRSPYQAPFYGDSADLLNPDDPRLFLPTTTTTVTSTSTATCTKSTATACRRRRGIQYDGDEDEQFPIVPSAVEGVEATQVSTRDARAADPQLLAMAPSLAYQPQSAFRSGAFNYHPVVVPYFGSHGQPVSDERLFFTQIQSALTVTKTSTVFTVTTSTSTPTCSKTGTIAQCPNA
ncbi:uncharacterized protein LOC130692135 [Daphnia carinata]|uniref:uncharacterized protein LOC130692135 n=1 Tax=Daphnia carinata TaxID=120202 RepID=UPI00257E5B6C|nr:uncharacterized protein LOC130692135 [Daphnia carinata]